MNTITIAGQQLEIHLPKPDSHKGDNGKLLIIGGSQLFHAASKWSLDVAAKFVDMVFYASVPSNNQLVREAKEHFWNGIVVERPDISSYLEEADCILIGPGMTREAFVQKTIPEWRDLELEDEDWSSTALVTNSLLAKYPDKKWVLDAGSLHVVEPLLLTQQCILTPHQKEFQAVQHRAAERQLDLVADAQATIVLTGAVDTIFWQECQKSFSSQISGGNAGMTKGGTGDVLAGLIAALFCSNSARTASFVGSLANKKAGETLYQRVGPFYNASDLVAQIPQAVWQLVRS